MDEKKLYFIYRTYNEPSDGFHVRRKDKRLHEGDVLIAVIEDTRENVENLVNYLNERNKSNILDPVLEQSLLTRCRFISRVTSGMWYDYYRYTEAIIMDAADFKKDYRTLGVSLVTYSSFGDLQ